MKQYRLIVVIIFLTILTSPLFSLENAEAGDTLGLQVRAGLTGSASISSSYIVPEAALVYKPAIFGIGAGVRSYFGLTYNDAYLVPYLTGEIGWLGVKIGAAIRVKEPDSGVEVNSDTPFFASADLYPSIRIGPGRFFFGGGLSLFPSTSAEAESDSAIGTIIGTAMVATMSLVKVELGAGYRLIF